MEYQMICIHLHILQPCDLVHHFQVLHFPGIDILSFILSLNGPIPKIAYYVQASGGISCTSYVIADFVLKIDNFRCHGNKGSLPWQQGSAQAKCDRHSWIGRRRKPYHRTRNYDSILCTAEVMANFLVKFPIFRYHGNRGRLSKVWLTPLNWPNPKTP